MGAATATRSSAAAASHVCMPPRETPVMPMRAASTSGLHQLACGLMSVLPQQPRAPGGLWQRKGRRLAAMGSLCAANNVAAAALDTIRGHLAPMTPWVPPPPHRPLCWGLAPAPPLPQPVQQAQQVPHVVQQEGALAAAAPRPAGTAGGLRTRHGGGGGGGRASGVWVGNPWLRACALRRRPAAETSVASSQLHPSAAEAGTRAARLTSASW
jgi:hypothetical protein